MIRYTFLHLFVSEACKVLGHTELWKDGILAVLQNTGALDFSFVHRTLHQTELMMRCSGKPYNQNSACWRVLRNLKAWILCQEKVIQGSTLWFCHVSLRATECDTRNHSGTSENKRASEVLCLLTYPIVSGRGCNKMTVGLFGELEQNVLLQE